ncbi:unnamed protein product [Discula destructiva]
MPPSKRPHNVIDLTGSSPVGPRSKQLRTAAPSRQASASSYTATPSHSSQVSSRIQQSRRLAYQQQERFDDEPELVDLTQADDGPVFGLYGNIDNKIVGVRYYNGIVSPGEVVVLRREPSNPYDRNAVRVDNVIGAQVGHLPKKLVEKLVPYIDSGAVHIEGVIIGEKGYFDCPIRILVYGSSEPLARAALEARLKADKLLKATQLKQTRPKPVEDRQRGPMGLKGQSTAGSATAGPATPEVSLEQLAQASQSIQFRAGDDKLKALAMDEDTLSRLPMASQPGALKSQLLPYQLQGLKWLQDKETPNFPPPGSDDTTQLWKRTAEGRYYNVATNFTVASPARLAKGGILADDMGLGKTLQMISLILTGGPGPTLIVAPVSVMSNWADQSIQHVKESKALSVRIYHGAGKLSAQELKHFDVVVTSYGTLASDNSTKGPLFSCSWRRVILDEGHNIRNAKTKLSLAAGELKAESRWVLSGTPLVNSVKDLQSMVAFLKLTGGIEDQGIFNTVITRPLALGSRGAELLLQSLMQNICLRRKKDMAFVDLRLPPKHEFVHRITFHAEEQKKYSALLSEAKGALEEVRAKSKHGVKSGSLFQSVVLEKLLRLRQVCNHWTLCKERVIDLLKTLEDQDVVVLNDKNRDILQQALALVIEAQEECSVCLDQLTLPVITACKHAFCGGCVRQVIDTQGKCPLCRAALTEESLVEPAPEASEDQNGDIDLETQSSKTEAMLTILQATFKKEPTSKVIIFSQWTKFLTIIENQLRTAGYRYTRIDGSMNPKKRDAAIHDLQENPECRVMLASLAVCSVGLNLVAANTVILADSWWAPAIEDQAVDRCHRLGQTRETTVWRLVMEGTVEERVLGIQAEKRLLVGKAFQEKNKGQKTKETRMADVMRLLS